MIVDVVLVVAEVVEHRLQRGVDELQLRGRQIQRERDLVGSDEVWRVRRHAPDRTAAPG